MLRRGPLSACNTSGLRVLRETVFNKVKLSSDADKPRLLQAARLVALLQLHQLHEVAGQEGS
eukprot:6291137-Prymnesium_polylepis.1